MGQNLLVSKTTGEGGYAEGRRTPQHTWTKLRKITKKYDPINEPTQNQMQAQQQQKMDKNTAPAPSILRCP